MQRCIIRCLIHLAFVSAVAWAAFSLFMAASLFWEYLHNPYRTLNEILVMAPLLSVVAAVITPVVMALTFGVSQSLFAIALFRFGGRFSIANLCALAAALPLLAVLSFECYDRLVPSVRFLTDPDIDWQHGISVRRFLVFFVAQLLLASFSAWRLHRAGLLRAPHILG